MEASGGLPEPLQLFLLPRLKRVWMNGTLDVRFTLISELRGAHYPAQSGDGRPTAMWRQMILAKRCGSQFRGLHSCTLGVWGIPGPKNLGRPTQRCFCSYAQQSDSGRKELHGGMRFGLATPRTRKILEIAWE